MSKMLVKKPLLLSLIVYIGVLLLCGNVYAKNKSTKDVKNGRQQEEKIEKSEDKSDYDQYLDFFEEVYQKIDTNYYQQIEKESYDRFIHQFDTKIYPQLRQSGKSVDFIRWRSAAFLVDFLKSEEDIFSAFYPPKPAKEYEQTSLGKKIDLGIKGQLTDEGFQVEFIEPRSDAYIKGLREKDVILKINSTKMGKVGDLKAKELLSPLEDSIVHIQYFSYFQKKKKKIDVISQEYFKQTVFDEPIPLDFIYCLKIDRFNRKTSDDVFRFLQEYRDKGGIKGLIIDLRGNPGGPPLAAKEISSFFLPSGSEFAYFKQKDIIKGALSVPKIPQKYHYDGPMVILVNKESGSASELFSGILQRRQRAILMGTNSAGQVMLKSMFHLDDDSMILLITARGHHPDGHVFSFGGLIPEKRIEENREVDILKYAAKYLVEENLKKHVDKSRFF